MQKAYEDVVMRFVLNEFLQSVPLVILLDIKWSYIKCLENDQLKKANIVDRIYNIQRDFQDISLIQGVSFLARSFGKIVKSMSLSHSYQHLQQFDLHDELDD